MTRQINLSTTGLISTPMLVHGVGFILIKAAVKLTLKQNHHNPFFKVETLLFTVFLINDLKQSLLSPGTLWG